MLFKLVYTCRMNQNDLFWDVRLRSTLLRRGEMTLAQETAYLKELKDVAGKSVPLDLDEIGQGGSHLDEDEHG